MIIITLLEMILTSYTTLSVVHSNTIGAMPEKQNALHNTAAIFTLMTSGLHIPRHTTYFNIPLDLHITYTCHHRCPLPSSPYVFIGEMSCFHISLMSLEETLVDIHDDAFIAHSIFFFFLLFQITSLFIHIVNNQKKKKKKTNTAAGEKKVLLFLSTYCMVHYFRH